MRQGQTLKQRIGNYIIPRLPVTKENFDRFRFEMNSFLLNIKNGINPVAISKIRQLQKRTDLSVNVGAGPFGKEGWVNIDMFRMKNITITYDCRKKLPFTDDSVSRIRSEHVFEHLDRVDEAPKFLNECYRCLKTGGVLRIVVPDLELFVHAYCSGDPEEWKKIGYDLSNASWGPMEILNHTFRQNGEHKFGYDFETLRKTVSVAGFARIEKMSWGRSLDHSLEDDLENHRPYSLYVDCVK
jgi:predicted SAM-dependent methyltransferase